MNSLGYHEQTLKKIGIEMIYGKYLIINSLGQLSFKHFQIFCMLSMTHFVCCTGMDQIQMYFSRRRFSIYLKLEISWYLEKTAENEK